MNPPLNRILETLHRLTGFHRQLLDAVRAEHAALLDADLKAIQSATATKQGLIENISRAEVDRLKHVSELAMLWKKHVRELTLSNLVIETQVKDPKFSESLRSAYNALTILIQRISEANQQNKGLVERSLTHVREMSRNVLGEATPKAQTYNPQGQRSAGPPGARLISKEA